MILGQCSFFSAAFYNLPLKVNQMLRNRRAKIVATVGPASASPHMLRNLFNNGADTFRLNFSHGDHATHKHTLEAIRALEADVETPIGVLLDLQGPKIRLGQVNGSRQVLERHEKISFANMENTTDASCLPLPHPEVFESIQVGHHIFIDDGRVRLRVVERQNDRFEAEVLEGGTVSDRKGVNLPDCVLNLPVLTEKDRADLAFGLENEVDWVALSFVQHADDLNEIKSIIAGRAGLIAKIEKPSALTDIEQIVSRADGIMIARGDLGVEIPPENVPAHQKEIIALCRRESRPVIVATQMLESMTSSPAPTRAEASDVATAIYDGADAVMLSAESASGDFPAEAVDVMDRILRSTESHSLYSKALEASRENCATAADAIADSGSALACTLGSKCIVAFSMSGLTAIRVAARRPELPLIVLTRDKQVSRRMALVWGARSFLESSVVDYDSMVTTAKTTCSELLSPASGSTMIVLSGVPFGKIGSTNNIRVATFG
jgi:pyruvate kinase